MPSAPEYSRLLASPQTSESDDVELLTAEDGGWHATIVSTRVKSACIWLSESTAWNAFTLSLVLSLAISAVNLTFLSARTTLSARYDSPASTTISLPLKHPDVYIGLERVAYDPSRCLSRSTYPDAFYTYDARRGDSTTLRHVHAPEDEVTLIFGGPIRAIMEAHVLDYGLENCTFVIHGSNTTHPGRDRSVDVYLLPHGMPDGRDGEFLDSVDFVPGRERMSRPFHCPSRSRVLLELRCSEDDCMVQIPLQGITSKSATPVSGGMAGFRMNQYEAVACIDAGSRGILANEEKHR